MPLSDPAARWRGASAALLTVALAVCAHALGGGTPSGAGAVATAVLACTIGALSASTRRAGGAPGLITLIGGGQILGHLVLAAAGHSHTAGIGPTPLMLGTHAAAVIVGGVLIAAGDHLCRVLSTVVRALIVLSPRPSRAGVVVAKTADQPLQWMRLLQASVSHRGPPVGLFS